MYQHPTTLILNRSISMNIYKITNTVTNKFYIGKTIKSIEERFRRHKYNSVTSQTHLHRSMRKHGEEVFIITLLESVVNTKELDSREIYWIDKLNPEYNMTSGGEGGDTSNSPNFIAAIKEVHSKRKPSDYATYGMLGKEHPNKGGSILKSRCPVVCDGVEYSGVGEAQKHLRGVSVRRRIDNPKYPSWYRLREKRVYSQRVDQQPD